MSQSNYGMGLPFNMEAILANRGADLIFCPKGTKSSKECKVIVDETNRMITGMSASEAQGVSEEIVRLLNKNINGAATKN